MKVLVTGGSGYFGSILISILLLNGHLSHFRNAFPISYGQIL